MSEPERGQGAPSSAPAAEQRPDHGPSGLAAVDQQQHAVDAAQDQDESKREEQRLAPGGFRQRAWRDFQEQKPLAKIRAVAETALFFAAIFGAVMVYFQLEQAQEQLVLAQKQMKLAQDAEADSDRTTQIAHRPWATVTRVERSGTGYVTIIVTNTGESPALGLTVSSCVIYAAETPATIPCLGAIKQLGRGAMGRMDSFNYFHPLPAAGGKPGESVYVLGRLQYGDMFKQQHVTTYCYVLGPDGQNFEYCDKHNDLQ